MINIRAGSVFINKEGRTIKISEVNKVSDRVSYVADGGYGTASENTNYVIRTLEAGGYKDITDSYSNFFAPKSEKFRVGEKISCGCPEGYWAEIIKKDSSGIHVRFSSDDKQHSTVYIYEENGFDFKSLFNDEIYADLRAKFNNNVFEVIGVTKDNADIKFTVVGKGGVNKELIDKIDKVYYGMTIYQIKRLTNINIQ